MREVAGVKKWIPARVAPWALLAAAVVGTVVGKVYEYRAGAVPQAGRLEDSLLGVAFLSFPAMGALIVSRRRDNVVGWILLAIGIMVAGLVWGMGYATFVIDRHGEVTPLVTLAAWLAQWLWLPLLGTIPTLLFLFFPDGKVPSPRWRWVAWTAGAFLVLAAVPSMLHPRLAEGAIDNPIGVTGAAEIEEGGGMIPLVLIMFVCTSSLFFRYRNAGTEQRQQLKWFAISGLVLAVGIVAGDLLGLPDIFFPIVLMGVPASIALAILKYRLYDIDVIVNRTLVYAALTGILALAYLGIVFVLQTLLSGITKESDLAVAGSTLAVSALFRPLRARVQAFIDRRFYRRRYDAQHTLESFSSRLRDEVDLEHLAHDLAEVVRETMQPAHVSIWLRVGESVRPV